MLMRDLTRLPHQLDREAGSCRAIIETPKGNRSKYDYDPETDLFWPTPFQAEPSYGPLCDVAACGTPSTQKRFL
jgi:hypothetical protein